MALDLRNTNSLWASVLVETLVKLGLSQAVVCPGSRSTPLTIAFANHPLVDAIPILDERSASFFALGLANASALPVVLVCTSGTAGANFYPAIIESRESRIPLLVLSADRPPELRDCAAGQAIDQQKLFGNFPNWYGELAVPQAELGLLRYLRQTLVQAWRRSQFPSPGPVHLNCPFRDPLAPLSDGSTDAIAAQIQADEFFQHLSPMTRSQGLGAQSAGACLPSACKQPFPGEQPLSPRGLIIAGPASPRDPRSYCDAVAQLSQSFGWPVLAESLSPLRNYASLNPLLISTYDGILRNATVATHLRPQQILQLGPLPTSKVLRQWLAQISPQRWILDEGDRNLDALHGPAMPLYGSVATLAAQIPKRPPARTSYAQQWLAYETQFRHALDQRLQGLDQPIESKMAWLLSCHLPPDTPLMVANSMPVRDLEWFWQPGDRHIRPYFNRGANGIDGTLSTALGIAHHHRHAVLLTGDLALLHDTNGFLIARHLAAPQAMESQPDFHLTIIVINNNGGGIFELLPVAQFDPPFETFFATPQHIEFAALCHTYGVDYHRVKTWQQCLHWLNPLPKTGIRLLELQTNRKTDTQWRQAVLQDIADGLSL